MQLLLARRSSSVETTTTIVEWPAHTMRRLLNDRTHYATAVGCTHDSRQQLKQIANLVGILCTNSIRSCLLASFFHTQKQWRRFQSMPFYASLRTRWFVGDGGDAQPQRVGRVAEFEKFHRVNPATLDFLLAKVDGVISRQNTTYRASISAAERLSIALRFLATRKCLTVIGLWPVGWCDRCLWPAHTMQQLLDRFVFRIGPTTVAFVKSTGDNCLWYAHTMQQSSFRRLCVQQTTKIAWCVPGFREWFDLTTIHSNLNSSSLPRRRWQNRFQTCARLYFEQFVLIFTVKCAEFRYSCRCDGHDKICGVKTQKNLGFFKEKLGKKH